MLDDIVADDIAQSIRVPIPATQDRLLPPWTGIASRLRAHPAGLALLFAEQTFQKKACVPRNTFLPEQRTYPLLHLTKRRRPQRKRLFNRRCLRPRSSNHGCPWIQKSPQKATVMLSRSAGFPTLRARMLGENSGFRGGQLARGSLSAVAVQELAIGPGAVQPLLRRLLELLLLLLLQLFPGLGRLFFGFLQSLLLCLGFQAQLFGPRLGALLLALLFASRAFAADRLQIRLEVVGAVVVVDLFAGLDVLDRADHDLALAGADVGLRVRLAGMIDVTGDVLAHRSVDGPAVVELEQIFVLDRVVFLLSAIQQRTKIADDFGALLDRFGGEETKPGAGTADAIGFIRRYGRHDR